MSQQGNRNRWKRDGWGGADYIALYDGGSDNVFGDKVSGGEGDDIIYVDDGAGGDIVDCGENLDGSEDTDKVVFDEGDIISPNCERQKKQVSTATAQEQGRWVRRRR